MGYRRADINLLPPELQPGPVVRYAVIINTILIGVTVAFLIVDSFLGLTHIASLQRDIESKENQIESMATIKADYNELISIEKHVNSVGRLIALVSAEYTDMPVLMERITKLLPPGVYAESISLQRGNVGSLSSSISATLFTSRPDPALVIDTMNAFKADDVVGDCYMRFAEFTLTDLEQLLTKAGINWDVSGPDIEAYDSTEAFSFEIYSTIYPPVETSSLAASTDKTEYFDVFNLEIASATAGQSEESGSQVSGAPEGVTAVEAY